MASANGDPYIHRYSDSYIDSRDKQGMKIFVQHNGVRTTVAADEETGDFRDVSSGSIVTEIDIEKMEPFDDNTYYDGIFLLLLLLFVLLLALFFPFCLLFFGCKIMIYGFLFCFCLCFDIFLCLLFCFAFCIK